MLFKVAELEFDPFIVRCDRIQPQSYRFLGIFLPKPEFDHSEPETRLF